MVRKIIFFGLLLMFSSTDLLCQGLHDTGNYSVTYYPNGKILSEGYLRDGKPDGYWKSFYTTGILKSEGNRKNFLIDSVWIFYNSVGDTIQKINYILGRKTGYSLQYFTDRSKPESIGKIKSKELYINNVKDGTSYYYFDNGLLNELVNYSNGKKEGLSIEYDLDGRIISIKKFSKGSLTERERINRYNDIGQKEGTWKEFYYGIRVKKEMNFINGFLDGYYKEYNEQGKLLLTLLYNKGSLVQDVNKNEENQEIKEIRDKMGQIKETGSFKGEIPVGVHNFYSDGKIIEIKIFNDEGQIVSSGLVDENGQREGDWKNYYHSGALKDYGIYRNNLKEGKWIYYFENGKTEQIGNFLKGYENSEWKWYYSHGELWRIEQYYNGQREGNYIEYDTSGNTIVEGEYFDGEMEREWKVKINDFIAKGNYIGGLRDGKWKYFYDDGVLMFEGDYIQGNPEGKHKYYYADGSVKEEQFFAGGIPNKHWKKYDGEGNIIVTITYEGGREYRINGVRIDLDPDQKVIIR